MYDITSLKKETYADEGRKRDHVNMTFIEISPTLDYQYDLYIALSLLNPPYIGLTVVLY
jgi:hypothetical protein